MEGILCFKIDWANLIVGRKSTVFALFYLVFEGNFQVQAPGAYIWRGDLTDGFLRYKFGDLYLKVFIQGGAYFRIFTVSFMNPFTFPFIHQDDELIKISKDGFFHWYLIHQIFTYLHVF